MSFNIDALMDPLEEIRLRKRNVDLIRTLAETTHFNRNELETLLVIHYKASKEGPLDRKRFRELLHQCFDLTNDYLQDRIFSALDKKSKQFIDMETWAHMLSLFFRGTLEEKIRYAYSVYDPMEIGYFTKEMLFVFMRKSILRMGSGEDVDESVKEMTEILLRKMDLDRDGKVSFQDYRESVKRSPMLLEALGQVLPTRDVINAFLTTCMTSQSIGRF